MKKEETAPLSILLDQLRINRLNQSKYIGKKLLLNI